MNKRAQFKPLDFDEDTKKWSWPPTYEGTNLHKPFKTTIAQMEDVLWTLVHNGGEVADKSGLATAKLQKLLARQDTPPGGYKQAVIDLTELGLIDRDVHHARRCYRLALAIPVEQVPGKDPHVPAWSGPVTVALAEEVLHPDYIEVQRPVEPIEIPQPSQSAMDTQRLAVALLDEVVRRATAEEQPGWAADRNHIAEKLAKAEASNARLDKEVDVNVGTIKALRSENRELRETIKGLEKNLRAALEAARDLAEKAGITPSQETQTALRNLMTRIPGFDKGVE